MSWLLASSTRTSPAFVVTQTEPSPAAPQAFGAGVVTWATTFAVSGSIRSRPSPASTQTLVRSTTGRPDSATEPTTEFVDGSIWTTRFSFGTFTQMPVAPAVISSGPPLPVGPTVMVATTLSVAGSIRTTVPWWCSATQTAPSTTAT